MYVELVDPCLEMFSKQPKNVLKLVSHTLEMAELGMLTSYSRVMNVG